MIVDSSAVLAILSDEPDGGQLAEALGSVESPTMSAGTFLECSIVIDGRRDPLLSREFDEFMSRFGIVVAPVDVDQARVAREAYRDYGRGSGHPAKLNFGDCFAYALASVTDEPLLYKGDDFSQTDLRSALD